MFSFAALNETSGRDEDPDKIKLTKTKEAKEAEAFAVYNKALSYQQKGHSVHAEKLLKNLLVEHPLLQEASDLVEDEKQASIANHRGLQLLYSVHKNMAAIYLHRNELDSAIKSYIEAVRIDPSEVTVWFKMGQIALKLDKFALAKICFQQALECNSKHWPSLDQAITLTFALGDYLMCLEYIATALENDSSYMKGLALKKQIVTEQPSLEGMTSNLFDNCDKEIHRVRVTKEERKEFVNEAAKIRSKGRQLVNDFHEEQNKPVAFLEPLTPFTWKNMGEQLIKLYDFATNNDSPKSLGQEVDLRDYFFLDPTLFLGQDTNDDASDLKSKEIEKRKSPNRLELRTLKEGVGSKQLTSVSGTTTGTSAFQRASSQSDLRSKAIPDVLGIQDGAKESALLKRMQGRMLFSSSIDSKQKSTGSSFAEEEAMEVSENGQSNEKEADSNVDDNIEDIDIPLLNTVDLDMNLTDIQKIDLKPELLLKADDEEFSNLADIKSLDNVLSSVIDMEYEREERDSESNSDKVTKTKGKEPSAVKKLSFSEDKPQTQDINEVSLAKELPGDKVSESSLKISNIVTDLQQEMLPQLSSVTPISDSPIFSAPLTPSPSQGTQLSSQILDCPSTQDNVSQKCLKSSALHPPHQTLGGVVDKPDQDVKPSLSSSTQVEISSPAESKGSITRLDSTGSDHTLVAAAGNSKDMLHELEDDSSVFEKTLTPAREPDALPTSEPIDVSTSTGDTKVLDCSSTKGGEPSLTSLAEISTAQNVSQENRVPSQLASLLSKPKDDVLMSENPLPAHVDHSHTSSSIKSSELEKLEKAFYPKPSEPIVSLYDLECSVAQDTPVVGESMISPLLKAALTETSSVHPRKEITEQAVTVVESKFPQNEDDDVEMKCEHLILPQGVHKQQTLSHEDGSSMANPDDQSKNPQPAHSDSVPNPPVIISSSPSKPFKDFSISSLISTQPLSDSALSGSSKYESERGIAVNVSTRDTATNSSLSPRGPSDITKAPVSGVAASHKDTAMETDFDPKPQSFVKPVLSPRKSTGDLIEDVIRSELNLAGKQVTPTKPSSPHHSSSTPPKFHHPSGSPQEHSISAKSSSAHSFSSPQQCAGMSPSHTASASHSKKQSPQKANTPSPGSSSSTSKARKSSSPGTSSPYSILHPQHRSPIDALISLPAHTGFPITPSDILHHSLHKELAFLNLPLHYINSISTLEAEAILCKAATSPEQQREDAMIRDLILRHSQHQTSLSSAFINPSLHNPRQLSRSLSSPGYFSDQRHQLSDFPSISHHHPYLSPPIPAHTTQLPLPSYPIPTPILPEFHPTLVTTHQLPTIPSPYPLLSHLHDNNAATTTSPYSNLYPPLSPRSKYPLIPSTSPSYLRSRLPPHLTLPYDTTSALLHLHPHLPPNWLTTTTGSEIDTSLLPLPNQKPTSPISSNTPVRKALFSTSSNQSREKYASPLAKSKKVSSSHRPVSSTEVDPTAVTSSRHEHFQKMIEEMLESSPSTSASHGQLKTSTKIASAQSGSKESTLSKSKYRSPVTSMSSSMSSRQQRAPKRKLEELGTSEWAEVFRGGRSTRSRTTRGKKEEPVMDITKLLLNHFPERLLELTEVRDKFLGDDENKEVSKLQGKTGQEIDLSKVVSIADGETEEVKAFLKGCLKGNGILDLIFKYLLHLSGRVSCIWTESLTETFMHVYKRLRKHIRAPSVFDNFDGYTPEGLDRYARVMLAYCELVLDAARLSNVTKAPLMSPEAGSGARMGTEVMNVTEQLGEFYDEDMTFLSAVTRCEDVIGCNYLDYSVRIYWLKAKHHQLCRETLDAIDCFQMVTELIGQIKEESSKVVFLPNLKEDKVISQQEVEAQVDALQRFKSLENTRSLFEKEDYSSVVDSLLQTFNKKSVRESKERPSQLLLLQDSLDRLGRKEECLHWAEVSIAEALAQFNTVKTQPLRQTWSNAMATLFIATDRLLSESITILTGLGCDRLTRLSHNLVSVIKVILETGRSSEMPVNSLLPWIILYKILKHEESKAEKNSTDQEVDQDAGDDKDADEDDDEDDSDLKPSIKMLMQAHDHLGRHGWCTKEDGVLLFFLMKELDPLIAELEEDDDDRELCVQAYEQCLFCLYNHPSKKGKAKHLHDHQAKPIPLTWDRAMPVFHYFTQAVMPEFDSKKTSSIPVEVEHLLRRIVTLVPSHISPNSFTEAVTSFIDGTTSDVLIPSTFQRSLSTSVSKEEDELQRRLYYLLADFYMKNGELKKAVKFYQLDLLMNKSRMDSWAGLALAKMSQIEQELSSIDLRLDAPAPKKWDGAMRCFQRAVHCDEKSRKLWVEFGLLAYQLQAHASRQACVFASTNGTSDLLQNARSRRDKYLESAMTSFSHALDCKCDGDGSKDDWLIHYMLGKIAEKRSPRRPGIFLNHYAKAAKCLHTEKALYPEKIQFATMPPHLALEALEVFYRSHASILKLLMHNRIADEDLPQVYTMSVRSLTGNFARRVKHKGTSSEADREEKNSTSSSSGQNQAPSVLKGKRSNQPKSAISDHSYSKERKTSSSQSGSEKSNAKTDRRRDSQRVEKLCDRPNENPINVKDAMVCLDQDKETNEPGDDKGEKDIKLDTDSVVVKDTSDTPIESSKDNTNDSEKMVDEERVSENTKESASARKEADEKPDIVQSQSSQDSERSVSDVDRAVSDVDRAFDSSRMEVVDSSSQVSSTSNMSALSRVGYSTAEEPEVTATSSQQSTQESLGMISQDEEKVAEEKDENVIDSRLDREKGVEGMDIDMSDDGMKGRGVGDSGRCNPMDRKAALQKQASEGFSPRMMMSSQSSMEDFKMDSDYSEDMAGEKDESVRRSEAFVDNVDEPLIKDTDENAQRSIVEISEESSSKKEEDVASEGSKENLVVKESDAVSISVPVSEKPISGDKEERVAKETEAMEKWEKEDKEKSSDVGKSVDSAVPELQMNKPAVSNEKEKENAKAGDSEGREHDNKTDDEERKKKVDMDNEGREKEKVDIDNEEREKEKVDGSDIADVRSEMVKDGNEKCVIDGDDDVIMIDSPQADVAKTCDGSEAKQEFGKTGLDQPNPVAKDKGVKEVVMDVEEDYVVIPPDVSMVRTELIRNCIRGIEMSASRFSSHYKSLHRLAHFYFFSMENENVELARDLLLGKPDWQDRPGMPAPGLFHERKGNNFFQGLWKIPIDDIDRSGSFASHVHRSVQLLLNVLETLGDLEMLNHVRNQMKRTPDSGKKYLRDWDRQMLVDEAFQQMLNVVQRRMTGGGPSRWSEEQKENHLARTFCVWRWGKGCSHMQRATGLLHQAFRIMMKGRTDVNRLTPEQAILYCQQNLSKATIQPTLSLAPSHTNSPIVRAANQSTIKRPSTSATSSSSIEAERKIDPVTNTLKDGTTSTPSEGQARHTDQQRMLSDFPRSQTNTSHPSQQTISNPASSRSLNSTAISSSSSSSSSSSIATTVTTSATSILSPTPVRSENTAPKLSQHKDTTPPSKYTEIEKKHSKPETVIPVASDIKLNQQGPTIDLVGLDGIMDKKQSEHAREEETTSLSKKSEDLDKPITSAEAAKVLQNQTDKDASASVKSKAIPKNWENVFSEYVKKCSDEKEGSTKSGEQSGNRKRRGSEDIGSRSSNKEAESGEWGKVFSEYVQNRIGQSAAVNKGKGGDGKSWENAFSQFVHKQGVEQDGEAEKKKKRKLVEEKKEGREANVVAEKGADGNGVEKRKDEGMEEDDDDVIVISDAE